MKYIKVPEPVQIINIITGTPVAEPVQEVNAETGAVAMKRDQYGEPLLKACSPWSFYDILTRFVFADKALGLKGKALSKFMRRMTKTFKLAKSNDYVPVDDADIETLKKLFENNEWGAVNGQLGDFYDAVDNASEDDPRKKSD